VLVAGRTIDGPLELRFSECDMDQLGIEP
jgi:hypothetical protein